MDENLNITTNTINDTQRNNRFTLICYTAYNILLLVFYLLEVAKKSRTIGYFAIFAALSLVPLIAAHINYKTNPASEAMKYIVAFGYPAFYIFTIFTTVSPVAFVYGILIATLLVVYADMRLSGVFGAILLGSNIAHIIYLAAKDDMEDVASIKIRVAFVLVYVVFSMLATKTTVKNNEAKMLQIAREKEYVSAMLEQIMEISNSMTGSIGLVYEKMERLEDSVSKTMESMEEVSNGTNDTAESVQNQLIKTEEIQEFIQKVEMVSNNIGSNMEDANAELEQGKEKIDELINQVAVSEDASGKVSAELEKLAEHTGNMQSIIELIDNITSQTSLLSLNASIEAARVGEAGKGFAVVASEISNLAEQTQNATVDITELINNISMELDELVAVVSYLMDNSKLQSIAATETASSFETIASMMVDIKGQTDEMSEFITELASTNESIVDSIQTISAATEEVTAHSNVTLECSEENSSIVDEVGQIVCELQTLANRLNKLEEGNI